MRLYAHASTSVIINVTGVFFSVELRAFQHNQGSHVYLNMVSVLCDFLINGHS